MMEGPLFEAYSAAVGELDSTLEEAIQDYVHNNNPDSERLEEYKSDIEAAREEAQERLLFEMDSLERSVLTNFKMFISSITGGFRHDWV